MKNSQLKSAGSTADKKDQSLESLFPADIIEEAKRQHDVLVRGTDAVLPDGDLLRKLCASLQNRQPLKVKAGFDPTSPHLHLGHTVLLQKLRQFQRLGHTIQFLIGDFTARIGDPTGRNEMRPPLTDEQIAANAATYQSQVFKLLDPETTDVVFNATWLGKLAPADWVKLTAQATVAQMLERDDFKKRYQAGTPIGLHELLYPLMQGYDSVELASDVELGGTDQRFNLLVGRDMQQRAGVVADKAQCVMMLPILEGLDGVQKMSKSLGNAVGIDEPAHEMYGKIMSISDTLMARYIELLTDEPARFAEMANHGLHPMEQKKALADEIVGRFCGEDGARAGRAAFEKVIQGGQAPDDIEEFVLTARPVYLPQLLLDLGFVNGKRTARERIVAGALTIDGVRMSDPETEIEVADGAILKFGKRQFAKLRYT